AEADEELHFACAFRLASGEPAGRRGPGGRIPEGESPGVMRKFVFVASGEPVGGPGGRTRPASGKDRRNLKIAPGLLLLLSGWLRSWCGCLSWCCGSLARGGWGLASGCRCLGSGGRCCAFGIGCRCGCCPGFRCC